MCVAYQSEEQATGFLTHVDNITLERDTAQAEAAELRVEIARLKADNKRNRDLAAGYRNDYAGAAREIDAWRTEVDDLHNVIADLRRDLGIRLP